MLLPALVFCVTASFTMPGSGKKHTLRNTASHDITYIKPLTSLAGFNLKFGRDSKKDKDASVYPLGIIIHL